MILDRARFRARPLSFRLPFDCRKHTSVKCFFADPHTRRCQFARALGFAELNLCQAHSSVAWSRSDLLASPCDSLRLGGQDADLKTNSDPLLPKFRGEDNKKIFKFNALIGYSLARPNETKASSGICLMFFLRFVSRTDKDRPPMFWRPFGVSSPRGQGGPHGLNEQHQGATGFSGRHRGRTKA